IALLIAHSFLDYPLRTGALMAILAFACALLLDPPSPSTVDERENATEQPAPIADASMAPSRHEDGVETRPRIGGGRWGEDIEWPQVWRSPRKPGEPHQ